MTGIDTDDLYGLPLERFVPERDALARAERAEGRREEAAAIARLTKPSVAAWVVNQLVRGNRDAVKSLLDAGDALREAQEAVIEGRGDGHSLRAAVERERSAVDDLVGAARGLAGEGGPSVSATIIDRVADTLHAAAFDEEAREQVRDGRLERELRHVGLGALAAGPLTQPKRGPAAKPAPAGGKRAVRGKARKPDTGTAAARKAAREAEAPEAKQAEAETRAAKQAETETRAAKQAEAETEARAAKQAEAEAHRAAKTAEAEARRRVDRATRSLARAEERREQAAQALREADQALAAARSESEEAAESHGLARERLAST